jgi:prefoldin subunit 5
MSHAASGILRLLPRPARVLLLALLPVASLTAAETPGRFTGSPSCATSMCHGGAGELRHQTALWQKQDIHSRTYNTLVNARSAQIAAALKIPDATTSSRCTTCHAPFHDVPKSAFLADIIKPTEGVSCESCHGPAEKWIRPHTRPDFSHRDRVLAGLRDLKHLYVRANSCVACHQTLEPALLAAGHPELIFELDGQAVSQPKHWREKGDWHGPQAWLVGQAVALREMSAQINREKTPGEKLLAPWAGTLWLLQKLDGLDSALPALKSVANATQAHPAADALARRTAELEWSHELTRQALQRLARTHTEFADRKVTQLTHARRAERLVLALDRLTAPLDKPALAKLESDLKELFALAQSLPDFAPEKFGKALEALAKKL